MKIACICLILALLVSVAWALRNLRERQLLQTDYNEALREIARLEGARSEDVDELKTAGKRKTKNHPSHPLTISYNEAARRLGVSRPHLYLVATGQRQSKTLSEKLSPYLKHQEDGIGRD